MDAAAILAEAHAAAEAAVRANAHLENPNAFDCGFAWVIVKPATHPFIRWVGKAAKADPENGRSTYGWRRDYGGGGWEFFMPGGRAHNGQSIAVFQAGAKAFAEVLERHGVPAQVGSRLD